MRLLSKLGRTSRLDFVIGVVLLGLIASSAKAALSYALLGYAPLSFDIGLVLPVRDPFAYPGFVFLALGLVHDLCLLILVIRRLHDMNRQAYWGLAVFAAIFGLGYVWRLGGLIIYVIGVLALIFKSGTIGPNEFGADPKGWTSLEEYEAQKERLKSGNV